MKKIISLLLLLITLLAVQTVHAASTFTVTNTSGTSKFVITRTTNTSTTETVKYRTVSLSAIAGMHFTEKVGELTFDATHNSREVEVTETPSESVDEQYHFQTGTTRSYRFEVLDLGGFKLASCDRNITYGSTYQHSGSYVNKSVTDLVYFDNSGNIQSGSGNKYLDVSYSSSNWIQVTDAGYSNQQERSISTDNLYHSSSVLRNYLTRSYNDYKLYATVYFTQKEEKDGYQYIQIYTGNSYDGNDPNGSVNNPVNSLYKACFILSYTPSGSVMSDSHYQFFPHRYDYVDKATEKNNNISHYEFDYDNSHLYQQKFLSNTYKANTSGSLVLSPSTRNINVRFDAGGGGNDNDEWDFKDLKVRLALVDAKAPTTLAYSVAPGMHAKGNTVYVSVAFSEIVTGTSSKLTSNWGDLSYVAGSGSNVMTFSRTIPANASGSLNITGYSGITDLAGNAPSSVSASGICAVDASTTFTITYDLSGGSVATDPPTGYTWETAAFTLNNPVRPGYIFAGWTGSNGNTPQTTVTIPAGSHGNKAYTANWTPLWGQDDGKTGEDKDHAYVISSTDGLDMLAKVVNGTDGYTANTFEGKFFKLGADITYTHISEWNNANSTENNYTAIGRLSVNKFYTFMGTFDGGGYTVSGIRIYKKDATDANSFQGLFGRIGENGIVRNITLDDSRITGNTWSGGIAGNNVGTVDNCHVTDQVLIHTLSTGDMHGGIAGRNSGLLKNSTSAATLSANSVNAKEYGGIAGYNLGTVRNCLAVGTSISSQNQYVGAIVGVNDGGTLVSNYYRNCTVGSTANAINVGVGGESSSADQAGARSVHSLTLPTGVTATGESVTIGTDTYYARYTTVTLNIPTGSVMSSVSYNDGTDHNITGNTFTMPAADVTVSATLTDLWDITSDKDGTTAEKAYTITTTAGLDLLATLVNGGNNFDGKYFKLGADITYTNTTDWNDDSSTENNFTAIGGYFDGHWRYFGGTFDGQNHTVRGIRIYKGGITSADSNQGLFGCTSGATIRNVILADARITGMQNVGGIAGFITDNAGTGGIVENCRVGSDVCIHAVADNASNHGGVVGGCNDGTISGCVSSATLTVTYGLTGINSYGGIVGYLNGDMSDCLSIDASVPDVDANGAIAGIFYTIYTSYTLTNNYYYNCTVGGATTNVGVGYDIDKTTPHDCDGARSVHSVTLPTGVTATGESVTNGTDTYYVRYTTVRLNIPTGYVMSSASYNDGDDHDITDNTFTMPAADVTVTADYFMTWASLKSAMQNGGTFTLPYDITATETDTYLYVPSGKTVTLDLNGHTINRNLTAAANNGYVIGVDGTLTINDSSDSNTGSITGGNSTDKCGGVYVSGTFTMNGGTVTGNTGRSGGVYVSGTFTMNGGTVTGNTAISGGGGVYVLSTFNMSGGTISNNSGAWGGGVYVSGTFTMNGGTISNNSGSLGGGVYVNTGQTINISGNPVITGNTNRTASNANNVYLESGMVITVTGALATGASIGVSMKNNTGVFTSGLNGNGTVANFTCDNSSECGVYLNGNGEASIIVDVWGIPDGADGTSEATAYTITTTRDLDLLAKKVNGIDGYTADKFDGKFFKLGNDITYAHTTDWNDATSIENNYTSIGFQYDKEFWGTFDGDGHTISGIRIYKGNNNCQGLFGYARGTVKNVTLSDARITGCSNVGGIVGYLTDTDQLIGTVNNCHVDGNVAIHTVVSNADYHGGIVGYSYSGTVINCTSQAVLTVADNLTGCDGYGGIVGQQYKGSVSSCLAIGATIPDVGYDKGAIAGRNVSGSLATNYYYNCTIGDVSNATSVGVGPSDINNNNNPEGAVAATILSESETVPSNLSGKVAFRREFTGGKASTICLPFALTDIEGGKAYEFVDVTYDAVDGWVATMNEVTATVANKPYLFLPEGSGSVPVLFHGTAGYDVSGGLATTSGDWTFTGTYTNLTYGTEPMTGHIYGFASKSKTVDGHDVEAGQFVHAKEGASVPPMRCYLTYKNGAQRAPMRASALGATGTDTDVPSRITVRLVSDSGTVTAVGTLDTVTGEMDINTWYDMNGRLLETEPTAPGLYIHNGKTIMIMK